MLAKSGYLGCSLPPDYGGQGWDIVTFGLLNEALGRGSSVLDGCADGPSHGFHGATEVGHGGAKRKMASSAGQRRNDRRLCLDGTWRWKCHSVLGNWSSLGVPKVTLFILNGHKKWISCAQIADVFLVFGKLEQRSVGLSCAQGHSWSSS